MYREIVENVLSGTKAGFKATRNLIFNQKAERSTMNRQKSRRIVENVLSGTKAGFKAILNFEHAIERNKMDTQKSKSTVSAILLSLTLMVTAFWVSPAAAQKYVTDPTTGKVVTAPEYGGTLTVAQGWEPPGIDHHVAHFVVSVYTAGVLEKLGMGDWGLDRDVWDFRTAFTPESFQTGALAESWEQPDPLTYIFHIRKGVYWHDKAPMNGRELTARDVEYNFHRMTGLGSGYTEPSEFRINLQNVPFESVTATDQYTVVMKLKEPSLAALAILIDDPLTFIYPPEVIVEHGDANDWRNLVGTGPWMITDLVDGSSLTYTKNPNYWGYDEKYPENRLPYIDKVERLLMTDSATRLAAMRTGQVAYLGLGVSAPPNLEDVESLQKTNPEIVVYTYSFRSDHGYALNVTKPPFDDIRVRRAMQMALDLETLSTSFWKAYAPDPTPQGMIHKKQKAWSTPFEEWPEEIKGYYTYDPEGAERLLDEAGYTRGVDGIRFRTNGDFTESWNFSRWHPAVADYWKKIGVDVQVQLTPLANIPAWTARIKALEQGMTTAVTSVKYLPSSWMTSEHHSTLSKFNRSGVSDPTYDALAEAVAAATTIEEQMRLVKEADMYSVEQHWYVWGPVQPWFEVYQPWVIGFNGEIELGHMNRAPVIWSRLWIDSELKAAMGH